MRTRFDNKIWSEARSSLLRSAYGKLRKRVFAFLVTTQSDRARFSFLSSAMVVLL